MAFGEGKLSAGVLENKAFMALFSVLLPKEACPAGILCPLKHKS